MVLTLGVTLESTARVTLGEASSLTTYQTQETQKQSSHMNSDLPIKDRVEALISQMTLEEKVLQMVYDAPAIERLGMPAYNWWNEGLHGVGRAGAARSFRRPSAWRRTWNPDLMSPGSDRYFR